MFVMHTHPLTFCRFASINNPGANRAEECQKANGRKRPKSASDI